MTTVAPPPVRAEDAAAFQEIIQRLTASWQANDPDTLSMCYSEDASIILPGAHLKGRTAIREFMAQALATKWKGTHVYGVPLEMRYLSEDVALLISHGGAYPPGATEVPEEHAIRGLWIFGKQDGRWIITSYGNTPVRAPIPME